MCMTPSASAASVPGRIGIHQSDFAAVGLRYGSMVTICAPRLRASCSISPEVNVRDRGVRTPVHDVAAVHRGFGIDHRPRAERDVAAGRPGGGADRAVEQARAEPVEEAPVEAAVHQLAHRAGIAVRQNRLRAVFRRGDLLEARGDLADRLGHEMRSNFPSPFLPIRLSG